MLEVETVEVVVQVNGKIRDRLHVAPDVAEDELVALARGSERCRRSWTGAMRRVSSSSRASSSTSLSRKGPSRLRDGLFRGLNVGTSRRSALDWHGLLTKS